MKNNEKPTLNDLSLAFKDLANAANAMAAQLQRLGDFLSEQTDVTEDDFYSIPEESMQARNYVIAEQNLNNIVKAS